MTQGNVESCYISHFSRFQLETDPLLRGLAACADRDGQPEPIASFVPFRPTLRGTPIPVVLSLFFPFPPAAFGSRAMTQRLLTQCPCGWHPQYLLSFAGERENPLRDVVFRDGRFSSPFVSLALSLSVLIFLFPTLAVLPSFCETSMGGIRVLLFRVTGLGRGRLLSVVPQPEGSVTIDESS